MKTYRRLWRAGWLFLAILGTGISTISLPWPGLIMLTLVGSAAGVLALTVRQHYGHLTGHNESPQRVAMFATHAAVGTVSMLGVTGLSALLGSLTLFLLTLMAVTSPWALHKLHRFTRSTGSPVSPPPESERHGLSPTEPQGHIRTQTPSTTMPLPESLRELSDAGLCRAWRTTYLPVREARDAATLEQLAVFRKACLDEIERRNAHAFHAWLDAGARASGDPTKFLITPGDEGQTPHR